MSKLGECGTIGRGTGFMTEGGGGTAFPVVFFDGETEINVGDVKINPACQYEPLHLMISQKIRISPNQISIYLVHQRKNSKSPSSEDRRIIPINGKVNFGSLCLKKEFRFLVLLKRLRKSRKEKERMINGGAKLGNLLPENELPVPKNMTLPRRNQPDENTQLEPDDFDARLERFRAQLENYQMATAKRSMNPPDFGSVPNLNVNSLPVIHYSSRVYSINRKFDYCEDCWKKNGTSESFHPCVNDEVVTGFRTRAGPISGPNKKFLP